MSFSQCRDELLSRHDAVNLQGLTVERITKLRPRGAPQPYKLNAKPRIAPGVINSTCWRGYTSHFVLTEAGELFLDRYVALDEVVQPVGETLTGKFIVEVRGESAAIETVELPFIDGHLSTDLGSWTGSARLLARLRMLSKAHTPTLAFGRIKWFGGVNKKTGRSNDFGFISAWSDDVYFHQSQAHKAPETLVEGAAVVFEAEHGRGSLAAKNVRLLAELTDDELIDAIGKSAGLSAPDTLAIALQRRKLEPFVDEVAAALSVLAGSTHQLVADFWAAFPPSTTKDALFDLAPQTVQARVYRQLLEPLIDGLKRFTSPLRKVRTALSAERAYVALDARDEALANIWRSSNHDAALAKMLSARAAEKAVSLFFRELGKSVEDIAVHQLSGTSKDWTDYDLLVDGNTPVDVKNARRPVNGRNFYVEHTVPRFKVSRRGANVLIAGVLSPHLRLSYIREPDQIMFDVDDLVFLGVTSEREISRLSEAFNSPTLEILRLGEGVIPSWLFGYPRELHEPTLNALRQLHEQHPDPSPREWSLALAPGEAQKIVPAFLAQGLHLPYYVSTLLTVYQRNFYEKLRKSNEAPPSLATIYFTTLSDFIERITEKSRSFEPRDYLAVLFADAEKHRRRTGSTYPVSADDAYQSPTISYPGGTFDPLSVVVELIDTLQKIWEQRERTRLLQFTSFRLSGLGIFQARRSGEAAWTTLIAYCGGMVYETGAGGDVLVSDEGVPLSVKGRCGYAPLVIGRHQTCEVCGKLICLVCRFCTLACQEQRFAATAARQKLAGMAAAPRRSHDGARFPLDRHRSLGRQEEDDELA